MHIAWNIVLLNQIMRQAPFRVKKAKVGLEADAMFSRKLPPVNFLARGEIVVFYLFRPRVDMNSKGNLILLHA